MGETWEQREAFAKRLRSKEQNMAPSAECSQGFPGAATECFGRSGLGSLPACGTFGTVVRLFDGVQPGQAQSTVAPLGVSSSQASSSGPRRAKAAPATARSSRKLQLLKVVSRDSAAAVNRPSVWVRPSTPQQRKRLLMRARVPSGSRKVLTRRPVQLRRIGGQMYRLVTNGQGHTLQREQSLKPRQQVARAFVEGLCLRGALCPHKHMNARMVKELRASRSLVAPSQILGQVKHSGDAAPEAAAAGGVALGEDVQAAAEGQQQKKRKWRYFWAEDGKDG
ncbi:hypothetical protein WJX75_008032 [Coccomyxa subellipsoidea]|uniref:C3H1-type domain-containing protein n=1 Tax=Coccomyxa subellipsoidea TaxID=248742 RepID=A0ABR2Z4M5_9CHLO